MLNQPPNRACPYCNEDSLESVEVVQRNQEGARIFLWKCQNGEECPNNDLVGHSFEEEAPREGGEN